MSQQHDGILCAPAEGRTLAELAEALTGACRRECGFEVTVEAKVVEDTAYGQGGGAAGMGEDGGSGGGGGDAGGLTHLSPGARSHSETHPHEPVPGDTRVVHAGTRNIQHPVVGHGGNRSDPRVTHLRPSRKWY